jgi:hypothetical protein
VTLVIIAVAVGAYGATGAMVGARYWRSLSQAELDREVDFVELQLPPHAAIFVPLVRRTGRVFWGLLHGATWPYVLIFEHRHRPRN